MEALRNYRLLTDRVDALCRQIEAAYPAEVVCHRGCDGCCRHLTLFWVEGAALGRALAALPLDAAGRLREKARRAAPDGPCPLLEEGACLLYHSRPLICRTHGLPLLTGAEAERHLDYCPQNFRGLRSLPATAVIDLDRLNTALVGVNALFLQEFFGGKPPAAERLSIADFLLLDFPAA